MMDSPTQRKVALVPNLTLYISNLNISCDVTLVDTDKNYGRKGAIKFEIKDGGFFCCH